MAKFYTCGQEKMIFFTAGSIVGCCANLKTGQTPHLGNYGPGGAVDINELVNSKREHLAAVRRGETPSACRDCPSWQPHIGPDDDPFLFNDINLGHLTACNTDCYYCRTNSNSAPIKVSARGAPRLLPALKEMVERGYIDSNAVIRFGGGEPTMLPEFEELVDYFIRVGRRFWINSSGVKYSLAVERMLRSGREGNRLVISADSASNETYKVIKGFDLGKRMWDNIARYAKVGPDILEIKYIVLPENCHEIGDFVRKCDELGVRRVSIDLDSNPVIAGISGSLTDEIVEGIAVLIYEGKRRGMSVYQSGSGFAAWQSENGEERVAAALRRISGGHFTTIQLAGGYLGLSRLAEDLNEGIPVDWGRQDNATITELNSEPGAVYLREDASAGFHRVEQTKIVVSEGAPHTAEVIARPAGRSELMIELRDMRDGVYTRAKYDLERRRVMEATDNRAAIEAVDAEWVRCQLTFTPASSAAAFTVSLVDQAGSHVYQGTDQAGVHIRPLVLYPRKPAPPSPARNWARRNTIAVLETMHLADVARRVRNALRQPGSGAAAN